MPGIHHVTAIAGKAATNLAFYRDVLGLRLIKTTVNFDDPSTYHLYFGDEAGNPGSILTFFPHEHAAKGRAGLGEVVETAFAIPIGSLDWWKQHLQQFGVESATPLQRFGHSVLPFRDHDGTGLALMEVEGVEALPGFVHGPIPAIHAIRGIHGVTLMVEHVEPSAAVLTGPLGFVGEAIEAAKGDQATGPRHRYTAPGVKIGSVVDLLVASGMGAGRMGAGSVHHVAFRAASDEAQASIAAALRKQLRIGVTEQKDRNYFRSVYFREPAGVIFEIATDAPGFTVDETQETLGQKLMLPEGLEPERRRIEAALPTLNLKQNPS